MEMQVSKENQTPNYNFSWKCSLKIKTNVMLSKIAYVFQEKIEIGLILIAN